MKNSFIDELQQCILDVRYENMMLEKFEEASLEDFEDDEHVEFEEAALDKYGNVIGFGGYLKGPMGFSGYNSGLQGWEPH
jgi:hypothetical protein